MIRKMYLHKTNIDVEKRWINIWLKSNNVWKTMMAPLSLNVLEGSKYSAAKNKKNTLFAGKKDELDSGNQNDHEDIQYWW